MVGMAVLAVSPWLPRVWAGAGLARWTLTWGLQRRLEVLADREGAAGDRARRLVDVRVRRGVLHPKAGGAAVVDPVTRVGVRVADSEV